MKNKSVTTVKWLIFENQFLVILIVLVMCFATVTANATLVAHYEFEGSADDSTGNNIGIMVGDAQIIYDPERGLVLGLDGDGDYVDCGNGPLINNLTAFSIGLWFKTDRIPDPWPAPWSYPCFVCQRDLSNLVWAFILHGDFSGRTHVKVAASGIDAITTTHFAPSVGQWYHAAMTYDDSGDRRIRIYINGVEQTYLHFEPATGTMSSNPLVHVAIGDRIGSGRSFDGSLDDVRIYNRVLSEAEIMAIVPEPTTLCLLMAGAAIILRRRKM